MNITKEQADKVIAALKDAQHTCQNSIEFGALVEALSIMRGLADAEPVAYSSPEHCERFPFCGCFSGCDDDDTSPQAAQTAVKSESSAQAAQALAQPPSEGKPIEALAPTEAALREVVRLSEDAGLYDDFQTEAQERPAYPEGDVVGLCVCGSWSGGRCLRCEWRAGSKP